MDRDDEIQFNIGDKYENEKGEYEVIAINGNEMIIRWATGETVSTPMDLQRKILHRRMFEKAQKSQGHKPSRRTTRTSFTGLGCEFKGLSESDFKKDVTGTHWRRREELGGAVTRLLPVDGYRFNSWAPYNWPMIHWADERHRDPENPWCQGKFAVYADQESLIYGFYIERVEPKEGISEDFKRCMNWLQKNENHTWLLNIALKNSLELFDLYQDFPECLIPEQGAWVHKDSGSNTAKVNLVAFFESIPCEKSINPVIAKRITKKLAISKQDKVAEDIANLFEDLLPIYIVSAGQCIKKK